MSSIGLGREVPGTGLRGHCLRWGCRREGIDPASIRCDETSPGPWQRTGQDVSITIGVSRVAIMQRLSPRCADGIESTRWEAWGVDHPANKVWRPFAKRRIIDVCGRELARPDTFLAKPPRHIINAKAWFQ
jgi:hypothetical protein